MFHLLFINFLFWAYFVRWLLKSNAQLLARGYADQSIEFWDVGGNPDAALARGMFFEDSEAAGVLLVYDVSNPR